MKYFLLILVSILLLSCTQEVPENENEDIYIPPPASVVDKQFNFHVVDTGVWRSSQPNRESILRMKEHGLKTIINLRGDEETDIWESKLSDSLNIKYFSKPMDGRVEQDLAYLKEILSLIEAEQNQPVLVHCLGGKDRTGILMGMYRLKHTDIPIEQIKKEMIMYGHDSSDFPYIFAALESFEKELRSSR